MRVAREEAQLLARVGPRVAVGPRAVEHVEQHALDPERAPEVERFAGERARAEVVEAAVGELRAVVALEALRARGIDEQAQARDFARVEQLRRAVGAPRAQRVDVAVEARVGGQERALERLDRLARVREHAVDPVALRLRDPLPCRARGVVAERARVRGQRSA